MRASTAAKRLTAAALAPLWVCVAPLAAADHVNAQNPSVEMCAPTPPAGWDYHDSYEALTGNHPGGERRACYQADFKIPTDAANGHQFKFRFWMNPDGESTRPGRLYYSGVTSFGCGGWADEAPNQVALNPLVEYLDSGRGAEGGIACTGIVTVGAHPHWTPGRQLEIDMTIRMEFDWECAGNDGNNAALDQCHETWHTNTLEGGYQHDQETVIITYTLIPVP